MIEKIKCKSILSYVIRPVILFIVLYFKFTLNALKSMRIAIKPSKNVIIIPPSNTYQYLYKVNYMLLYQFLDILQLLLFLEISNLPLLHLFPHLQM